MPSSITNGFFEVARNKLYIYWHKKFATTNGLYKSLVVANKKFIETNSPRGKAVGVFRWFHFDLKVKNCPELIGKILAFARMTFYRTPRQAVGEFFSIKTYCPEKKYYQSTTELSS